MKNKITENILKNKKSVLHSWTRLYAIITLITVAVFVAISFAATEMYKRQMKKSDVYIMEHTSSIMDSVFESLKKSSSVIWLDSDIVSLFKIGGDISDAQYAEINDAIVKVRRTKVSNDNIESMCIVDSAHDRVYTNGGVVDLLTYCNIAFPQNEESYKRFIDVLDSKAAEAYIMSTSDSGITTVYYIKGFGYSGKDNLNQSIIISVSTQTLIDKMKSIKNIGTGNELYILDAENGLMASTGGDIYKSFDMSADKKGEGIIEVTHNGKKYILCYENSQQGSWTYIIAHPKSQYVEKSMMFQLVFSIGLVVLLLISVILMAEFAKRHYGPLFVILNMLGRKDDACKNEFDAIAAGIEDMMKVNKSLDKRIYNQNKALRNIFLEKLCRGGMDKDPGVLSDNLYMYDLKFTGEKFMSMVIFLNDGGESRAEVYSFRQIVFIISNVFEELINERHYGVVFECGEVISGIININDENATEIKSDMKAVVEKAGKFILDNFGIKFTAAFSSVYSSIENAEKGYIEAVDAMKYKNIMGIDEVMFNDEIGSTDNNGYDYSFEAEHQLSNLVRSGNADEAKNFIETIIENNLKNKQLNPNLIQYLIFNISSTVVRTMNEMSIEDSEGMMEEMDIVKHISEEETIKKKLESLYELIDKISSLAAKRSVVKNNWIATGVIPYIEEKYSDCNLSVSMIADKFGMHPVYTSRVFKEQTGTGLFEYISKYRIDQSKSILLNTNYTLENVAMQVGYASSRAFARMFKKTEGITPGQFRSAHQKHEDI